MAELLLARAHDADGFEEPVAIKRILPHLAHDPHFVELFVNEARLAAGLSHPNIAQVQDIGSFDGSYYFALEYIHGRDLREIARAASRRGRPLPLHHMLAVVRAACAGLHYAHEKTDARGRSLGLVHCDVSPANVLVTFDGCVKVIDFGVASAGVGSMAQPSSLIRGTVAYMSPEQLRGETLDRRSDVYALGILLYELTTRSRLFRAEREVGARAVLDFRVPSPCTRVADYPPELEKIVLKALATERSRRYASAEELHFALERFSRRFGIWVSPEELGGYMQELFPEETAATVVEQSYSVQIEWELPTLPYGEGASSAEVTPSAFTTQTELSPVPVRARLSPWRRPSLLGRVFGVVAAGILVCSWPVGPAPIDRPPDLAVTGGSVVPPPVVPHRPKPVQFFDHRTAVPAPKASKKRGKTKRRRTGLNAGKSSRKRKRNKARKNKRNKARKNKRNKKKKGGKVGRKGTRRRK